MLNGYENKKKKKSACKLCCNRYIQKYLSFKFFLCSLQRSITINISKNQRSNEITSIMDLTVSLYQLQTSNNRFTLLNTKKKIQKLSLSTKTKFSKECNISVGTHNFVHDVLIEKHNFVHNVLIEISKSNKLSLQVRLKCLFQSLILEKTLIVYTVIAKVALGNKQYIHAHMAINKAIKYNTKPKEEKSKEEKSKAKKKKKPICFESSEYFKKVHDEKKKKLKKKLRNYIVLNVIEN